MPTATFFAWPYPFDDTNYYELPADFTEPATLDDSRNWNYPDTYKDFPLIGSDIEHCDYAAGDTEGSGTLSCPGYPDVHCKIVPGPGDAPDGLNAEEFECEGVNNIPYIYCDFSDLAT